MRVADFNDSIVFVSFITCAAAISLSHSLISCLYVHVCVLLSGLPAAPNQSQVPTTSMAGGSLNAAATAILSGSGLTNPVSVAAAGYNAAGGHALGGGHIALPATAQPHSLNPAIDATLSQAYSGIAQYTGTINTDAAHAALDVRRPSAHESSDSVMGTVVLANI